MKLFMAVSNKDTDSESIIGIFDSRDKAEAATEAFLGESTPYWFRNQKGDLQRATSHCVYTLHEFELNKRGKV